jgi:hypothetical protein
MEKTSEISDYRIEWLNSWIYLSRFARIRELNELAAKILLIVLNSSNCIDGQVPSRGMLQMPPG